jgi:hypothetical protein
MTGVDCWRFVQAIPIKVQLTKLKFHKSGTTFSVSAVMSLLAAVIVVIAESMEGYGAKSHFPGPSSGYDVRGGVDLLGWKRTPIPCIP